MYFTQLWSFVLFVVLLTASAQVTNQDFFHLQYSFTLADYETLVSLHHRLLSINDLLRQAEEEILSIGDEKDNGPGLSSYIEEDLLYHVSSAAALSSPERKVNKQLFLCDGQPVSVKQSYCESRYHTAITTFTNQGCWHDALWCTMLVGQQLIDSQPVRTDPVAPSDLSEFRGRTTGFKSNVDLQRQPWILSRFALLLSTYAIGMDGAHDYDVTCDVYLSVDSVWVGYFVSRLPIQDYAVQATQTAYAIVDRKCGTHPLRRALLPLSLASLARMSAILDDFRASIFSQTRIYTLYRGVFGERLVDILPNHVTTAGELHAWLIEKLLMYLQFGHKVSAPTNYTEGMILTEAGFLAESPRANLFQTMGTGEVRNFVIMKHTENGFGSESLGVLATLVYGMYSGRATVMDETSGWMYGCGSKEYTWSCFLRSVSNFGIAESDKLEAIPEASVETDLRGERIVIKEPPQYASEVPNSFWYIYSLPMGADGWDVFSFFDDFDVEAAKEADIRTPIQKLLVPEDQQKSFQDYYGGALSCYRSLAGPVSNSRCLFSMKGRPNFDIFAKYSLKTPSDPSLPHPRRSRSRWPDPWVVHFRHVLSSWIFQMQPYVRVSVESLLRQIGLPEWYVGIHVRTGDKLVEKTSPRALEWYLDAIENAAFPMVREMSGLPNQHFPVFIATDNPHLFSFFEESRPSWSFLHGIPHPDDVNEQGDGFFITSVREGHQNPYRAVAILTDIEALRRSAVFVGLYGSNIGRVVSYLRGDFDSCISVDFRDSYEWLDV